MALLYKIKKDIKKSSYYVWFLGAQECKGLRGTEYITPVLRSLIQREKTVEPFKITLQVSHKGLKIVQNLSNLSVKKPEPKPNKNDVIKHVIPHHAVTCVYQEEDVVACVLLLYNPVTRCPVHVHAYRCDTVETATLLTQQLTTLIERPENQKKLSEIESRLRAKGLLLPSVPRVNVPKRVNSCGSDGRSTTSPASESSGGSSTGGQERLSHLYDSLAAELREKLGMSTDSKSAHAPILLPPRDYDTVHRQKGNLTGIELRRCLNESITGKGKIDSKDVEKKAGKSGRLGRILGSSGGSSGIGSDHPPSPEQNGRFIDTQSTSDEEWAEQPSEDSLFVVPGEGQSRQWRQERGDRCLPRAKRSPTPPERDDESPGGDSAYRRSEENLLEMTHSPQRSKAREETLFRNPNHWSTPNLNIPVENYRKRNEKGNVFPIGVVAPRRRTSEEKRTPEKDEDDSYKKRIPGYKAKQKEEVKKMGGDILKQRVKKVPDGTMKLSPQERFLDAKTKFLMLEKERLEEQEKNLQNLERKRHSQVEAPISPEIIKTRPQWGKEERARGERVLMRRNSFFEDEPIRQDDSRGKYTDIEESVIRKKKLSRSDSKGPFYSQERLEAADIEYEPQDRDKRRRNFEEPPRGMEKSRSREEKPFRGYAGSPSRPHEDIPRTFDEKPRYNDGRDLEKSRPYKNESPRRRISRDEFPDEPRRISREHLPSPHDGYPPSDEDDRWDGRRYSGEQRRRYSEDRDPAPQRETTPQRSSRYEEREARGRYEDHKRYNESPLRRSNSRGREIEPMPVPFEKSKYQALENEKRVTSNALANEFKRRSYQEQMDKREVAPRRSYAERELDERPRDRYQPDDFYENGKEYPKMEDSKRTDRRSRGYSYDEEDDSRRPGWPAGYQHLREWDRYPGLDKEASRASHPKNDRYGDKTRHREEGDRFVESGGRIPVEKLPARYRHSFVEQGGMALPPRNHEMLQRTNSSVSSNRVGIAAIHPY